MVPTKALTYICIKHRRAGFSIVEVNLCSSLQHSLQHGQCAMNTSLSVNANIICLCAAVYQGHFLMLGREVLGFGLADCVLSRFSCSNKLQQELPKQPNAVLVCL